MRAGVEQGFVVEYALFAAVELQSRHRDGNALVALDRQLGCIAGHGDALLVLGEFDPGCDTPRDELPAAAGQAQGHRRADDNGTAAAVEGVDRMGREGLLVTEHLRKLLPRRTVDADLAVGRRGGKRGQAGEGR